jgi:hypothetical protein
MSFAEDSMRSRALDLWLPLRGLLEADCAAADAGATAIGFGAIPMSKKSQSESRWLDSSESEIVNATFSPEVEQQSIDQLKALTHRLRQAHARAKDISARQQREILGKADPRGAKRVQDNAGSVEKVRVLFEAIQRVDGELSRREQNVPGKPSQVELSRHALELKMSGQPSERPDPGRSASEGMHPKKRKELFKVGTTRKEVGRVSQAGKVAQARKDSKG